MKIRNLRALKSIGQKIRDNEEGVAAIEFALIAPLLIGLYYGLAETTKAIAVDRSVSHATSVVGDLATQTSNITRSDLEDILSATLQIIDDQSSSKVTISLESYGVGVGVGPSPNLRVPVGSAVMNPGAAKLPSFDVSTVNPRLLNTTSGIIVSRVAYNYSPLKLRYLKTDFVLSDTFVLKPRKSALTLFDNRLLKRYTCRSNGKNVSCSG